MSIKLQWFGSPSKVEQSSKTKTLLEIAKEKIEFQKSEQLKLYEHGEKDRNQFISELGEHVGLEIKNNDTPTSHSCDIYIKNELVYRVTFNGWHSDREYVSCFNVKYDMLGPSTKIELAMAILRNLNE